MNNNIRELEEKLQTASGTHRIDLLNDLAYEYYSVDPVKMEEIAREAMRLAKAASYTKGVAEAHRHVGISYLARSRYADADEALHQALRLFETIKDLNGIAHTYPGLFSSLDYFWYSCYFSSNSPRVYSDIWRIVSC